MGQFQFPFQQLVFFLKKIQNKTQIKHFLSQSVVVIRSPANMISVSDLHTKFVEQYVAKPSIFSDDCGDYCGNLPVLDIYRFMIPIPSRISFGHF